MLRLLCRQDQHPVVFANGQKKFVHDGGEHRVEQVGPELVARHDEAPAVHHGRDTVQQIGGGRGANLLIVEQIRHIEPGDRRIETHVVGVAIERPSERIAAAPAFQACTRAFGRAMQQEFPQAGQRPHLRRVGELPGNAALQAPRLLGGNTALAVALDQPGDPFPQEVAIGWRILQTAHWREAARFPAAEHEIRAARRANQQLAAAILVEENHGSTPLGHGLLEHRQEEHEERGFPRADRSENGGHANITDMRDVIVGRTAIGAEPGQGGSPMTVPFSCREIIQAGEAGKISGSDRARPGAPFDVAG